MIPSFKKKYLLPLVCLLLFSLTSCGVVREFGGYFDIPMNVTIEGVTYRSGFYGELYPVFGEVGDIGSVTREKEIIYDDGKNEFHRVNFKEHDWVHSYTGKYTGGVVYCAEKEWEQMNDYYADPVNFEYYYGLGYYMAETARKIPEIDHQKFDELLVFGDENKYEPFDKLSNETALKKAHRIPEAEFHGSVFFYKESKDGYFTTMKSPAYFVHDSKLLLVFYHDGGRENGGIKEVVAIDVPDELGQYFIGLMEKDQQ